MTFLRQTVPLFKLLRVLENSAGGALRYTKVKTRLNNERSTDRNIDID
jgi:hypothetical protein